MPTNVTETYCTVQSRITRELFERVERYGRMHRYNVSELIREGLELRLEAGVPGRSPWSAPPDPEEPIAPEVQQALEVLMRAAVREELAAVLQPALDRDPGATRTRQGVRHATP